MALWVSEEPIHSGPRAHPGQGQELGPKEGAGSLGWVLHPWQTCPSQPCTPRTTLRGLVGLHRYVRAAHKVISSNSHSPSRDGGTPRAEDYFWPAGFVLLLLVPAEIGHGPLLPTPGTGAAPQESQRQPSLPAPRGFVPCYWQGQTSAVQC